jgi:hypothetical protein
MAARRLETQIEVEEHGDDWTEADFEDGKAERLHYAAVPSGRLATATTASETHI